MADFVKTNIDKKKQHYKKQRVISYNYKLVLLPVCSPLCKCVPRPDCLHLCEIGSKTIQIHCCYNQGEFSGIFN